jgi:hypothetical protein
LEFAVTYRQLLTDIGLAALLAAPTLTLSRPMTAAPTTASHAAQAASLAVATPRGHSLLG